MDSIIDVQCHFIYGSDAQGCKIVVISNHLSVGNGSTMLVKNNESDVTVSGQLELSYSVDCYDRVFAFDIEANGTTSGSAIIVRIVQDNAMLTSQCPITSAAGKNNIQVNLVSL